MYYTPKGSLSMQKITLYALSSKGKTKQWSIWVEDNNIYTEWGIQDGALQLTKDTISEGKNLGKSNETTPAEQALSEAKRKLEMKRRKGYSETLETQFKFDKEFFNNPPRNFVCPKPKSKLEESKRNNNRLAYTRKWNGMCVHIVFGSNGVKIFTANMDDKTDYFPWQIKELNSLNIPDGTWFMAEAVLNDDPDRMKTVFGALTDRALKEQASEKVEFKIFNMLFHKYKLCDYAWIDRLEDILSYFVGDSEYCDSVYTICEDGLGIQSYDAAVRYLKRHPDWEGLVIWDKDGAEIPIKFSGAPSRSCGAWKLKNFKEADLVVYKWETGKGRLNNDVATLSYGAYDENGELIHVCRGGSGLDGKLRQEIREANGVLVAEVKYEEKTKAGKLRLPVILRIRYDKKPEECLRSEIK